MGEIFVITDRLQCLPNGTTPLVAPREPPPAEMETVTYYKSMKPRMLSMLPPHIMYALYIDSDYVVHSDLMPLLNERFRLGSSQEAAVGGRANVLMFEDGNENRPGQPLHGALIIAHRTFSRLCFAEWNNQLTRLKKTRDQIALGFAVEKGMCRAGLLPKHKFTSYPNSDTVRNGGPWNMLVHVSRTGRFDALMREGLLDALAEQLLDVHQPNWWNKRHTCARAPLSSNASSHSTRT